MLERLERLLERRQPVPLVHLVEVDVAGPQPAQAGLAALDDVMAGEALHVRALAHRHAHLGGDQEVIATSLEHLADDLLGQAGRVHVGRVDHVDAGVTAHVDLASGPGDVGAADHGERAATAEGHGAQGQRRDLQAGAAQLTVFHRRIPSGVGSVATHTYTHDGSSGQGIAGSCRFRDDPLNSPRQPIAVAAHQSAPRHIRGSCGRGP